MCIRDRLHSRCAVVEFRTDGKEKPAVATAFYKRIEYILGQEGIQFEQKAVVELIQKHFPDFRRVLNELQRYSVSGKIDAGIMINVSDESWNNLFSLLKDKNFKEVRKWVAKNSDIETTQLFSDLFNNANAKMKADSVPQMVLILADYQYKAAFVADHELNKMAALTEIMASCKFK